MPAHVRDGGKGRVMRDGEVGNRASQGKMAGVSGVAGGICAVF